MLTSIQRTSYDSTPTASSASSIQSTETNTSTTSKASSAATQQPGTGLSPKLANTSLTNATKGEAPPKPLEPSGLVEVSEEEFERAKAAAKA